MSTIFDKYNLHNQLTEDQDLFEVNMSPGALNDFAKSEAAQSMTIGFEMELVMPDLPEENSYRGDPEPEEDMEMNQDFPRGRNWRQEVISWCTEGDEANSERDVERALEWMDEEFLEYLDEHFNDSVESDEDLQEKIKNEISDALSKAGKPNETDDIDHEFNNQTDLYDDALQAVKDDWHNENADDVWDNYLHRWRINDMEDFILFVNRNHPRLTLRYPYVSYNYPPDEESDQADYLQDVANELARILQKVDSNFHVAVSQDYHDEDREEYKFIIEPDGSISPGGREFISPAMPFADGLAAMELMFNWAKSKGYRTNSSTGFHMGISLPNHETQNIDHLKFVLMLGDEHVLQKFNRAKAHYAVSTLNTMRNEIAGGRKINQQEVAGYLRQMATGIQDLATKELNKLLVPRGHHTQSVNIKNNYMEIRSAGDNYLPRFDEVKLTLLRYLRTLEISANDQAYRREYAKKLSKFLTNTQMIRTVDPVTGRKSVAAKDSLDATVQQAFSEYFAALQRGEDGAAAIAKLTTVLNQYQGTKTSTLKTQLQSKRANNNKNSTKIKYHGATRVEFAVTGTAYETLDSIGDYAYQNEVTHNRLRAMYLQAPDGQQLWNVNFEYNAVVQGGGSYQPRAERNYWCFAPDKAQAIAQAKKAWNINTDNPGDLWTCYQQSGPDTANLYNVLSAYEKSDGSAPDDRLNSSLSQTNPTITGRPGTPRPAFSQPPEPDQNGWVDLPQDESGTYIITYQNPQGETHQTAYDADSANDAEQQFVRAHPFRYDVINVRLQESQQVTETLKKVKGKWALVSRHKPEKVLQYYHGSGHPSKEWVSKVERRVHSFESTLTEYDIRGYTLKGVFPDGDIQVSGHVLDRADEYHISRREIDTCLRLAGQKYQRRIFDLENINFVIRSHGMGFSLAISKVDGTNGYYYKVRTLHRQLRTGMGQDILMVEDSFPAHQNFRVYLDMDGVLADFFGEWSRLSGVNHYKDIADVGAKLQMVREHPTFWTNLPVLPHAKTLVRAVIDMFGEYYICSKPLEGDPRSAPGKRAWIQRNLSEMPPAGIVLTSNKAEFATTETGPAILIDDYGVNVNQWQMAGGIGLKYEDTPAGTNLPHVLKVLQKFAKAGSQL